MTAEKDDSQIESDEWSPNTPDAIESRIAEIRSTISSLDSTSPYDMSEFYYMHGFNELDLAVRDLLTNRGIPAWAKFCRQPFV